MTRRIMLGLLVGAPLSALVPKCLPEPEVRGADFADGPDQSVASKIGVKYVDRDGIPHNEHVEINDGWWVQTEYPIRAVLLIYSLAEPYHVHAYAAPLNVSDS